MNPFEYERSADVASAARALAANPRAKIIAGGTNLLDLMKEDVARPASLVDITRLPLASIQETTNGGVLLGALATNADTAHHELVTRRYPLLAQAILAGASPQLRNMATNGGNLLQRTRCHYFYDVATPCNKREPGSGCPAREGQNRMHAVLGTSEHCIAVHPSDLCVALAALDATVHVEGVSGKRAIPMADFHRLAGDTPEIDTNLAGDEVITGIELPHGDFAAHCAYLKLRDRASYAFALVSVAAALSLAEDGTIREARLALGGVAHRPWRDRAAEALLANRKPEAAAFREAGDLIMRDARGFGLNDFKIELGRRAIVRAFERALEVRS